MLFTFLAIKDEALRFMLPLFFNIAADLAMGSPSHRPHLFWRKQVL